MTMTPKTRLFLTIFLGVMSAMAPLSTDMYLPALPELSSDFGISASVTQMTLTMTMLGMGAGQMIMGPVSDRYGRKWPLLAGMAVFALTAFGCATVRAASSSRVPLRATSPRASSSRASSPSS